MQAPGTLLALVKKKGGGDAGATDDGSADEAKRKESMRAFLDAVKADDENAADQALMDWCHEYEEQEDAEGGDAAEPSEDGK